MLFGSLCAAPPRDFSWTPSGGFLRSYVRRNSHEMVSDDEVVINSGR